MEAEGRLSWDAGGRHGSRGGVGIPRRERVPVPRYSPGENPQARPPCSMASPSSFQVPGATHPGSGLPQVNAFCGHQGQEAAAAFTDRGVGALGDPGCRVTVPCHVGSTDFREWKPRVQVCRVGALWGSLSQRRTLSGLSCAQAENPRQNRSLGKGPARQGPLHLARNLGWPPVPAPGPQGFPGRSASAGLEDLLLRVIHGKKRGPLGGREGFHSLDMSPGTL